MNSWKTLAGALRVSISTQVVAAENNNLFQAPPMSDMQLAQAIATSF
ncbi:hypothetical protein [Pseudomonas sp.]